MNLGVVFACLAFAVATSASPNLRPVIGILTLPNDFHDYKGASYFPASYVKWVESGGARVAPIKYTDSTDDIAALVRKLNGVLFTGGGVDICNSDGTLSTFGMAGKAVFDTVVSMNKAGVHMPLWGTCLGFQMTNVLASGSNCTILETGFDSENITLPLDFTAAGPDSRMMTAAGSDVVDILRTQPVTMNNHQAGVPPAMFDTNPVLPNFFTTVSTNVDRKNRAFVSTVEGKDMPIYATQWHPEKVQFEWNPAEVMNHDQDSVTANSFFARWLVDEARGNANAFPSTQDETDALIYNYAPVFTQPNVSSFEQCYFFE